MQSRLNLNSVLDELFIGITKLYPNIAERNRHIACINPYPNEIIIHQDFIGQDGNFDRYYRNLLTINFRFPQLIPESEHQDRINWQIRQTHRLVYAVLSAVQTIAEKHDADETEMDPKLIRLGQLFQNFKYTIEAYPVMCQILNDIESGKLKPAMFCSGHGEWHPEFGYLEPGLTTAVLNFYTPFNTSISDKIGSRIEARRYQDMHLAAVVQKSATLKHSIMAFQGFAKVHEFPKTYSGSQFEEVPDFKLCSDDSLRARLIEDLTGRIYTINQESISLSQIIEFFPDRAIHWAACSGLTRPENSQKSALWRAPDVFYQRFFEPIYDSPPATPEQNTAVVDSSAATSTQTTMAALSSQPKI